MYKHKFGKIFGSIIAIVLVAVAIILGIQWYNGTGIFAQLGEVTFTENITAEQQQLVNAALEANELDLRHDVKVSTKTTHALETADTELLYDIKVPVTDFYNPLSNIEASELNDYELISVLELTPQQKLLSVDNNYYLDTLDSGAVFEYLVLEGNSEDVAKIATLVKPQLSIFPTKDTLLTFAQTGVTALSRGMNIKLREVGDASYFAENIGDFLSSFDLTHTSNESSFSTAATDRNICSAPAMVDTLTSIGLDIVELNGNHNQDCGDQAALDTLDKYAELGIQTVGGGATAELAAIPLKINQKGNNITFLAYNLSTGGYTLDNTPGANFYTTEKARADISAAKERGDAVIVDVQYYECNNYASEVEDRTCDYANSAAGDQISLFREIIDLGADVVVGTAAHQPQTYEIYGDGVIYYGLGNLFFDQVWWPGTTRSLILIHYFFNNQLIQTSIVPTIYDDKMQTQLMDTESAASFIERLNQARPQQ